MARTPTFRLLKIHEIIEAYNTLTGDGPTAPDFCGSGATTEITSGAVSGKVDLPLSRWDQTVSAGGTATINLSSLPVNGVAGVNTTQTVIRALWLYNTHATIDLTLGNAAATPFTGFFTPGTSTTTLEAGCAVGRIWKDGVTLAGANNVLLTNAGGNDVTVTCVAAVATA